MAWCCPWLSEWRPHLTSYPLRILNTVPVRSSTRITWVVQTGGAKYYWNHSILLVKASIWLLRDASGVIFGRFNQIHCFCCLNPSFDHESKPLLMTSPLTARNHNISPNPFHHSQTRTSPILLVKALLHFRSVQNPCWLVIAGYTIQNDILCILGIEK